MTNYLNISINTFLISGISKRKTRQSARNKNVCLSNASAFFPTNYTAILGVIFDII